MYSSIQILYSKSLKQRTCKNVKATDYKNYSILCAKSTGKRFRRFLKRFYSSVIRGYEYRSHHDLHGIAHFPTQIVRFQHNHFLWSQSVEGQMVYSRCCREVDYCISRCLAGCVMLRACVCVCYTWPQATRVPCTNKHGQSISRIQQPPVSPSRL